MGWERDRSISSNTTTHTLIPTNIHTTSNMGKPPHINIHMFTNMGLTLERLPRQIIEVTKVGMGVQNTISIVLSLGGLLIRIQMKNVRMKTTMISIKNSSKIRSMEPIIKSIVKGNRSYKMVNKNGKARVN